MDHMFEDYERYAPRIPGYTCPLIDAVLKVLSEQSSSLEALIGRYGDLRDVETEDNADTVESIRSVIDRAVDEMKDLGDRRGQMEKLREENDALRQSGAYWRNAAKSLSERLEEAQVRIEELDEEVSELRSDQMQAAA